MKLPRRKSRVHKLRRLSAGWQPPKIEEGAYTSRLPLDDSALALQTPEFSWVQETARHIGTVVHRSLERFGLEGELPTADVVRGRADEVAHQLQRLGVPATDVERAVRTVIQASCARSTTATAAGYFRPRIAKHAASSR